MCINTGISCCASEILVFPVWYVLMRPCISILLGQTKVDDIDEISFFAEAHQKVVRLDITMNEIFAVDIFNSAYLWMKAVSQYTRIEKQLNYSNATKTRSLRRD